jgi:cytochrome P450
MRIVEPITTTIEFASYDTIHAALTNPHLSRTFDKRSYAVGNVRQGIVSTMHGRPHRNRRRLENAQFRPRALRSYEEDLFPPIMERFVRAAALSGEADLFVLGEMLSIVLAAKRAGFDFDDENPAEQRELVDFVDEFSQASAIVDAHDPDAVRAAVKVAYAEFAERFGRPSMDRRLAELAAIEAGTLDPDDASQDILTALLAHRDDPALGFEDELMIVREAATYLQGGTHTSSQTLINAVDLLLEPRPNRPNHWERVKNDLGFAQRCMHETLRLRPTTPKAKRRAEADTEVEGTPIPEGALVVLDLYTANRDAEVFGLSADEFDPDREIDGRVPRWGLSFGAGPHICPGRKVAGGLPQHEDFTTYSGPAPDGHLFGLVAKMIQAVVRREPVPHPSKPRGKDDRTERFTRWAHYWVQFLEPH